MTICGSQTARPELAAAGPAYTNAITSTCLSRSTRHSFMCGTRVAWARSDASRALNQSRCAWVSHLACAGASVSQTSATTPISTAGTASRMKIHCQPRRPPQPFTYRIAPDSGEPIKPAAAIATMKMPTIRARYAAGNQ